MFFSTTIVLIFCFGAVSMNTLEKCPGASSESQEEFKWKYDAAQIVVYGTASDVRNNDVTLTINCTLKGQLSVSTIEVKQLPEVMNLTECHYLTAKKQYIVFLESMKSNSPDGKVIYRLADMEEIEVTTTTLNKFLDEECADEEDYGIEMTIFYADANLKCGKFTATCNQATRTSILELNYSPLTKSTTVLGGFKKSVAVPKMTDESISGKQSGATDDEQSRNIGTTISTLWMPFMVFLICLIMQIHF